MEQLNWTTVKRKVSDLIPQANNYKKLPESKKKKLIASLQKFSLVDTPVIDYDNTLVSGHQRLVCLISMGKGEEMIDVRFPNRKLTKEELKEYTLIANQQYGDVDFDLLDNYLSDVELNLGEIGIDLSHITGFMENGGGSDEEKEKKEPKTPETREIKPFNRTYVLISFPPERVLDIQADLEKLASLDFIEYDQISN